MAFYFFYQCTDTQQWQIALASDRERIVNEVKPFLTSVLDVDYDFKEQLSVEELAKVRYLGPVYFDFDCTEGNTIADVIPKVQEFASNLRSKGVDLNSLRFYATGGKGFHVEMPLEIVKEKIPKTGIASLPYVNKEFAFDITVEFMDMRVYTARRGRLWRTPNVQRPNGRYKVPISPAELFEMTQESYEEITSSPRPSPSIEPAKFNGVLGVLWQMCEDKVANSVKKRKQTKHEVELIRKFNGDWPDTVKKILKGEDLAEGVGFQRISLQLAIAAHALGKTEDDFLRDSEGLCDNHKSDGVRYNTFRKRRAELSRMFHYIAGNPCYSFEIGPLKALLKPEADTSDLTGGGYQPDPEDEVPGAEEEGGDDITRPIKINASGFYVKEDHGLRKVADIGVSKPQQLLRIDDGKVIGYEVNVHVEGTGKGVHALPITALQTKARFMDWSSSIASTSIQASDAQVSMIMDSLRKRAEKNGDQVWIISRQGVDLVCPYGMDPSKDTDVIWAAKDGVVSRMGKQYRLRPRVELPKGLVSDLHHAPDAVPSEEMAQLIESLFNMNSKQNMALILGWFFSNFISQFIRKATGQYPSLQIFGQMSAGKTQTVKDLLWMHTYATELALQPAASTTEFAMRAMVSSSASLPIPIDEVKPRDLPPMRAALIRDLIRNNYTGSAISRGNVNKEAGPSSLEIIEEKNASPLIFMGEALETESATLDRCVVASLSKESRAGREKYHDYVQRNRALLSSFGKEFMKLAVYKQGESASGEQGYLSTVELRKRIVAHAAEVSRQLGDKSYGQDRPVHNIAVVLTGLDFGEVVTQSIFGHKVYEERFKDLFDGARNVLLTRTLDVVPDNVSEAAKVLDVLAQMSYGTNDERTTLHIGKDYTVGADGKTVDLALKTVFNKYVMHVKNLSQRPLYDTYHSFYAGMKNYGGTIQTSCPDNPSLYRNPMSVIFRLSVEALTRENVEPFRNI